MSDNWYFVYLCPEEEGESYNKDEETVEYTVHFKELNENLASFFNRFYDRADGFDAFLTTELGCVPSAIWSLYEGDEEEEKDKGSKGKSDTKKKEKKYDYHYDTDKDVIEMLINTILAERGIFPNENSFLVADTREFDHEWAFFKKEAIDKKELGKHLSKLVALKDDKVVCDNKKVTLSAYLDDK